MKKRILEAVAGIVLIMTVLSGCGMDGMKETGNPTAKETETEAVKQDEAVEEQNATAPGGEAVVKENTESEGEMSKEPADKAEESPEAEHAAQDEAGGNDGKLTIRVGSLKGPTSMGLVYLMDQSEKGKAANHYEFKMTAAADELLPAVISDDLDIVLVPANMASVLYMRTEGGVSVIDINTLGVLYMVSGDPNIKDMEDLKGRTVYLTGKGTTPDYVLQYLLKENGLTAKDVALEYKSEAAEVAAVLAKTPDAIGVLPQPFVTAACAQNEELSVVMDLTKEWSAVQGEGGSSLVTGVTVVRNSFLEEHKEEVDQFLAEHEASAAYANEHVEEAANLVAAAGIIEKAPVAAKAMPQCNITYLDGEDMKRALSGYLEVLFGQDPASVGGGLPGDEFYYIR